MQLKRVQGGDLFLIYSHLYSLKLKIKLHTHTNTKLLVFVLIMAHRGVSRSIGMLFYMSNQRLDVPTAFNEYKLIISNRAGHSCRDSWYNIQINFLIALTICRHKNEKTKTKVSNH